MCITHSYFPSLLTSCRVGVGLALGLLVGLACPAQATGSWTPLSAQAPDAIGTTMLLTDGTVMAQGTTGAAGANGSGSSAHWYKLTPDAHGSYANGTWTKLADMHHERLYYASAVLRDGRVFVAGGEYTEAGYVDTNTAEIYDPVKDAWTEISSPAGWANIGDAPTKMLADGTVLLGRINGYETALYNPVTNTWAAGANNLGGCDEASWTLLPDQSILTVDINSSPNAERYLPSSGIWVAAGQTPVSLVAGSEIGPAVLMPSGQCLYVGATGHTAVYTLASSGAGTWAAGPDFPTDSSGNQLEAKDAPGCLLVNGKVLCVVAPHGTSDGGYPFGQRFFEYTSDPSGLSGGSLAAAPDSGLNSANMPAFTGRFLALPSGEALYSNFNSELMVYTPDSGPNPAWKPAISGVAAQADGSYQVSGTQFNGLSEGSGYGDDASQSTNYPLVRLTSGAGIVSYARTFNHSTMALATGGLPVATSFTVPTGLAPGVYQLQVVANGISSDPVSFTVPSTDVTGQVTITPGDLRHRSGTTFAQFLTLTNNNAAPIPGPLTLALDYLSRNARLLNSTGTTSAALPAASPTVSVSADGLAPGQSVQVNLSFADVNYQHINFAPRVLSGSTP